MAAVFNPHSGKQILLPKAGKKLLMQAIRTTENHLSEIENNRSHPLRKVYTYQGGMTLPEYKASVRDNLETLRGLL